MTVVSIKNRTPFPLEKGRRLRALSHLTVFIPIGILDPPETPFGEIINLSNDDADIGVTQSAQNGAISAIIVAMKPGDEICLGRSAEIAVDDIPEGQDAFECLSSA